MKKSTLFALAWLVGSPVFAGGIEAQEPSGRLRALERAGTLTLAGGNNAVIGVSLSVGSLADTLGLEVTDVTAEGPAAKAGISVGSRLQEINGVSLRISADDAADPLTSGAGYRRLQRELAKQKAGDAVTLRVLSGGQSRNVSVTTASSQELLGMRTRVLGSPTAIVRSQSADRAALGVSVGSAGNARDTLGVFVSSVVTDGPAEKAGIIEGDRIAAINGVDVRVPHEDARDGAAASARVSRFVRELGKVSPGDKVTLRVYANGRYRDVDVTAAKASEIGGAGFRFELGELGDMNINLRRAIEEARAGGALRLEGTMPMLRSLPEGEMRIRRSAPAGVLTPAPMRSPTGVRTVRATL